MYKLTISRYDRAVTEVTTRPNAAAIAARPMYQILAKRTTTSVKYYLVECMTTDEDIIIREGTQDEVEKTYRRYTAAQAA